MIRTLSADELEWFLATYYSHIGHSNPKGFAHYAVQHMRDLETESDQCLIYLDQERPLAGLHVLAPEASDDDQNLHLSHAWYLGGNTDLQVLLKNVLRKHHHEAAHYPLYNLTKSIQQDLAPAFASEGFDLDQIYEMNFALADLPPLGRPLVLEAWSYQNDEGFQDIFVEAEGYKVSDERWAYLKRLHGKFNPDFWFIARESIDQEPVGYAFFGTHRVGGSYQMGLDGVYYLTAAGVLAKHRGSTEMLRRLVLSAMQELASRSPLGQIETSMSEKDPKLRRIFESLGFETTARYRSLIKRP